MPDPTKDTSRPGREEEVIPQKPLATSHDKGSGMTALPVKDQKTAEETEGERRFKEGLANNNDTV